MTGIFIGGFHSFGETKPDDSEDVIAYDNLVLLFQKPFEPLRMQKNVREDGVGFMTVEAKCPWSKRNEIFKGADITSMEDLEGYVGTQVDYYFNDKKKLDKVYL